MGDGVRLRVLRSQYTCMNDHPCGGCQAEIRAGTSVIHVYVMPLPPAGSSFVCSEACADVYETRAALQYAAEANA